MLVVQGGVLAQVVAEGVDLTVALFDLGVQGLVQLLGGLGVLFVLLQGAQLHGPPRHRYSLN